MLCKESEVKFSLLAKISPRHGGFWFGISLVPRRSLLTRCPREVWERAGERTSLGVYLSVTSQLTVESRIDRAENA